MRLTTSEYALGMIGTLEGRVPRLRAKRCMGDAWEISNGVTFYPDGRPVQEGDTITYAEHLEIFRHAISVFENAVHNGLKVEVNQYQFDALVALAYNIGASAFLGSQALAHTNARRWEDAADAFGEWISATSRFPEQHERNDPFFASAIGMDSKGRACWIGEDGKPCPYRRAVRGLSKRHMAEACLYMGADWEAVCANIEDFDIVRTRYWGTVRDPATGKSVPGWRDRIDKRTRWADIAPKAKAHPLSPPVFVGSEHPLDSVVAATKTAVVTPSAAASPVHSILPASGPEASTNQPDPVARAETETEMTALPTTPTATKSPLKSMTLWSGFGMFMLTQPEIQSLLTTLTAQMPAGSAVQAFMSAVLMTGLVAGRYRATAALT